MLIKDPGRPKTVLDKLAVRLKGNKTLVWIISLTVYSVVLFCAGIFYHLSTLPEDKQTPTLDLNVKSASKSYDPAVSQPERIEIAISQKDFQKIVAKRNDAIRAGILMTSSEDYVPAKIRVQDKVVRAKMRLKGDWTEHLKGQKWSYRISVKDEDTILGMREFSIQHPKERNYISEWIFHQAYKREDVIGLKFEFIEVLLNGHNLGIYAMEEHFDKVLIESNNYREGPILKFDEDLYWANIGRDFGDTKPLTAFYSSAIDVFQAGKINNKENLKKLFNKAFNLMERFRQQELSASDVFNVELMARYYALADLMGGHHMAAFHNMRFYFNPITSKLEPIAFDAMAATPIDTILGMRAFNEENSYFAFDRIIFSDPKMMNAYLAELNRMSDPQYLQELFNDINQDLDKNLNILNKEFSDIPINRFLRMSLMSNRAFIEKAISPVKGVLAYLDQVQDKAMTLRIANIQGMPVEVLGLSRGGFTVFRPSEPTILPGKVLTKPLDYQKIRFEQVGEFVWSDQLLSELEIEVRVPETKFVKKVKVLNWPRYDDVFVNNDVIRQKPNVDDFNFFKVNRSDKKIYVQAGTWTIDQNIIIPKGYMVMAGPGVKINLVNQAKIISYSPFHFVGNAERPIEIDSLDKTGQGIVLLNAKEQSQFKHVHFKNLSAPKQYDWELTGALTFYESPVVMQHCIFIGNHSSDDYLNIVRSKFMLEDLHFNQVFADAIDSDFSQGTMTNLRFTKIGNDAIDFSGSHAKMNNIQIDEALDKGLSVGEASQVSGEQIEMKNTKIAFASKDSSKLTLSQIEMLNCYIGFVAFQKKPEFGPAQIEVTQLTKGEIKKPFLVENQSTLTIDGQTIQGQ